MNPPPLPSVTPAAAVLAVFASSFFYVSMWIVGTIAFDPPYWITGSLLGISGFCLSSLFALFSWVRHESRLAQTVAYLFTFGPPIGIGAFLLGTSIMEHALNR